jgi:hypothetical protein
MPATSLVCAPYRLVISTCYGELPVRGLKSAGAGLRSHPEFHPWFRQLIDLSHVVKLPLHFRDLYQLKHATAPTHKSRRLSKPKPSSSVGLSRTRIF